MSERTWRASTGKPDDAMIVVTTKTTDPFDKGNKDKNGDDGKCESNCGRKSTSKGGRSALFGLTYPQSEFAIEC
jgi:hypothetical protein